MFSNPEQNVAQLGIREGMSVADFGAGTGAYSKACSYKAGYSGKVYAIEVQKDLVKKLESDLKTWGISNVTCIWGDIEKINGTKLANNTMDVVIASNILFQTEDKFGLINEIKRVLKKNGRVLIIDWNESFGGMGPKFDHVVSESMAKDLFSKQGFKFVEKITAGAHHYGIIFTHE
jgi:ubiquinone/menaquinone biosynthesis C-methylase UbiE